MYIIFISGNVISQEIIGELDPNTGILYTNTPFDGQTMIGKNSFSIHSVFTQTHWQSLNYSIKISVIWAPSRTFDVLVKSEESEMLLLNSIQAKLLVRGNNLILIHLKYLIYVIESIYFLYLIFSKEQIYEQGNF